MDIGLVHGMRAGTIVDRRVLGGDPLDAQLVERTGLGGDVRAAWSEARLMSTNEEPDPDKMLPPVRDGTTTTRFILA
ncbi:hypothetical protein ACFO0M_01040 [Micromonospora mangrovi]|uniref:Uncharacterized protein n=2 Tax=Micromonospora TaxID=1873 RepID=A0AAU8HHH5_9ACTN